MTDLEKLVQTAVGKVPSLDDQQKKERHSPILYSLDLDYDEIQCLQTNEIFLNKTTCLLNILLCPLLINTKKWGGGIIVSFSSLIPTRVNMIESSKYELETKNKYKI